MGTMSKRYLTTTEAAEALGIGVRQLLNIRSQGLIASEVNPTTRRVRFRTEDVRKLKAARDQWKRANTR